ncbi:hypothetical protein IKE67_08970 [bacterium]|nr:hypothetical protein [bacterium]
MNKHGKIENLRPIDNSDEAINQAKSRGKIEASIKRNLLETLRSRIDEHNLIDDIVSGVVEEVQEGKYKNAIELLKIAKEPEKQEINLSASNPQIIVASESDKELLNKIQNVKTD